MGTRRSGTTDKSMIKARATVGDQLTAEMGVS